MVKGNWILIIYIYIKVLLANNKIVYVKGMDVGFGGIPSNVDAAMVWPANNKIYFFKGN